MADAVAPAPRERGWRLLLPALALFLLLPAIPLASAALPVTQTLLLFVTAVAACALLGWWRGGRASLAAAWCLLAGWMAAQPAAQGTAYDRMARGWVLLLGAAFGVVSVVGGGRTFFVRALSAVALALAAAGALLVLTPDGPDRAARIVREELARRGAAVVAEWRMRRAQTTLPAAPEDAAAMDSLLDGVERNVTATARSLPEATAKAFPALLALESLAALALAWSLYHRVSRTRIGPPLAPLREFRFNDQLVWGLIAGITALLLPTLEGVRGPGLNLVVFFGALYALRGLGVLVGLALVALLSDGVAFALGLVGIGDTWLDWRSRARSTT